MFYFNLFNDAGNIMEVKVWDVVVTYSKVPSLYSYGYNELP